MATQNNAVAVLVPGAEQSAVATASEKYRIQVVNEEVYSQQRDYERYFKPSRQIFHKDDVNLLFVFADGSAQLVEDTVSLKGVLNKVKQLVGIQ
ncbi:MAG: hypothetical protein JNK00_05630 [Flavipsychrobacter sp.]|nr:hypothetical protein [Flavipsychrobacter sp.]